MLSHERNRCHGATQSNIFEILLNQTKSRLYSPCTDWFRTKRTFFWFQINRKMVNTVWFQFDLIRFLYVYLRGIIHLLIFRFGCGNLVENGLQNSFNLIIWRYSIASSFQIFNKNLICIIWMRLYFIPTSLNQYKVSIILYNLFKYGNLRHRK